MTDRASSAGVSTHVLDTAAGRPAAGVPVRMAVRSGPDADWKHVGGSTTDPDGRCKDLPAPPPDTTHVRLEFAVERYQLRSADAAFFPEVVVAFAVVPGEHHHVPLLLSPFGYSVYRGS